MLATVAGGKQLLYLLFFYGGGGGYIPFKATYRMLEVKWTVEAWSSAVIHSIVYS
jgi:hypothetical protein